MPSRLRATISVNENGRDGEVSLTGMWSGKAISAAEVLLEKEYRRWKHKRRVEEEKQRKKIAKEKEEARLKALKEDNEDGNGN
jgi:hypothetical protein